MGQLPAFLGIYGIDCNQAPYLILLDTLRNITDIHLDMAFGFSSLILLLLLDLLSKRLSVKHKQAEWISISRNAIVVVIFTLVSFLVNRKLDIPRTLIIGSVPSGFSYVKVPTIPNFQSVLASSMTVVIVATVEHMAIVKTFGRRNGYNPLPGQELIAIGAGNIAGSFFGAFPATGSFTRSAISSQCGSKSPLTAFFTSLVVMAAIFFLMPLLYYIPLSTLAAVIICAIFDLIAKPSAICQLLHVDCKLFFSLYY